MYFMVIQYINPTPGIPTPTPLEAGFHYTDQVSLPPASSSPLQHAVSQQGENGSASLLISEDWVHRKLPGDS